MVKCVCYCSGASPQDSMVFRDTGSASDRRQYPRVKAPIYCRAARFRSTRRRVVDLGLGGVRVFSDEPFKVGKRLELELFLPDDTSVECLAEVVWVSELPDEQPAKYDVGLHFLHVPEGGIRKLADVLHDE